MAPETLAFLTALLSWAMVSAKIGDQLENLGGTRDSGIPPFAAVVLDGPTVAEVSDGASGITVSAVLPQKIDGTAQPVALVTFPFDQWPLTFAYHNAQLTAGSGSEATVDQWVTYVARGQWQPAAAGTYTFTLTFRSPAETGCYASLVIADDEVFPGFERKFRKKIPPRVVMEPGERRTFQRAVEVRQVGTYALELATGCYPGNKPAIRVAEDRRAAWQATEVNLQITAPGDAGPRPFGAEELKVAP